MTVQSNVDKLYSFIVSMEKAEYISMVVFFGFGFANRYRTELEDSISIWDMALNLEKQGYSSEDLERMAESRKALNLRIKRNFEYCRDNFERELDSEAAF